MRADDILKLLDAGYTKDEIRDLMDPKEAPTKEPEKAAEPEPVKEEPKDDPKDDRYSELLAAMNRLTGAIQAGNILNSNNKEEQTKSSEEILADVIFPNKRG